MKQNVTQWTSNKDFHVFSALKQNKKKPNQFYKCLNKPSTM